MIKNNFKWRRVVAYVEEILVLRYRLIERVVGFGGLCLVVVVIWRLVTSATLSALPGEEVPVRLDVERLDALELWIENRQEAREEGMIVPNKIW